MLNSESLDKPDNLQAKFHRLINFFFQSEYFRKISKKISDPSNSPQCYYNLLKTLLNGKKNSLYITNFSQ